MEAEANDDSSAIVSNFDPSASFSNSTDLSEELSHLKGSSSKKRKKSGNSVDSDGSEKKKLKSSSSKHRHSSGAGHLMTIKEEKTEKVKLKEKKKTKEWICPKCKKPDQTDSIMCDRCQLWFHFTCVGIVQAPKDDENWYCSFCVKRIR